MFCADWSSFNERISHLNDVKEEFSKRGYIRIDGFLQPDEVQQILEHLNRYRADVVGRLPKGSVFYENKANEDSIIRLEQMHLHDQFFKDLAESGVFNGLVDCLINEACNADNVQWFSKPPGARETPPHQDGKYFMHDRAVTMWLALDDVDEETGCLYYVPGSHEQGLLDHYKTDVLGFSQALIEYPNEYKEIEEKQVVKAGTLLAHHAYMVHRAGSNASTHRWRPALGLTYWAKRVYQDIELITAKKEYKQSLNNKLASSDRI